MRNGNGNGWRTGFWIASAAFTIVSIIFTLLVIPLNATIDKNREHINTLQAANAVKDERWSNLAPVLAELKESVSKLTEEVQKLREAK